jgi:hypothetical protein
MMEKDINVLLETTNEEIFEEQASLWPGMEIFRQFAWKCVCGDPDCFMFCCQGYGRTFPSPEVFQDYLERAGSAGIESSADLVEFTKKFAKKLDKEAVH